MAVTCVFTVLKLGTPSPNQIKILQHALKLKEDGDFGPVTKSAVMTYQRINGLVVDGIAGEITCTKLGIWCKTPPTPVNIGPIQKAIQDGTGKSFKSFTEFYNLVVKYCDYAHYFNDQKSLKIEISNIIAAFNGKPTNNEDNCVDYAQLGVALAKEMGYTAVPYGIYCTGDKINHAIFLISEKEFKNPTWIDLAAAASSNYPIGSHWCSGNLTKQPSWIPYE